LSSAIERYAGSVGIQDRGADRPARAVRRRAGRPPWQLIEPVVAVFATRYLACAIGCMLDGLLTATAATTAAG
jgi:hypothetical protein